jgi:hypothetical protein
MADETEHVAQGSFGRGIKMALDDSVFIAVMEMSGECIDMGMVGCIIPSM